MWKLIFGLGVLHVGATGARALVAEFRTLDGLLDAPLERIRRARDVGEVVGLSVHEFITNPANRQSLDRLRAAGLNFGERDPAPLERAGDRFAIRGHALGHHRHAEPGARGNQRVDPGERRQGQRQPEQRRPPISWLARRRAANWRKAKTLGVKTVDEAEFRRMLGGDAVASAVPSTGNDVEAIFSRRTDGIGTRTPAGRASLNLGVAGVLRD